MSNKHDANVRKSTLVNFQIGLIASLLFTYFMFEVYTAEQVVYNPPPSEPPTEDYIWDGVFKVYEDPKQEDVAVRKQRPVVQPEDFEVIEDHKKIQEAKEEFKNNIPAEVSTPINPDAIDDIVKEEDPVDYDFIKVEFAPIFPGCERLDTNEERVNCFSEKVKRMVSKKFDTDVGKDLGLYGLQRIYVQFDVHKDGTIQNIKARGTPPLLEQEAIRVVKKFPTMTPGRQRDKNVTVKYQLPIVFKIQE